MLSGTLHAAVIYSQWPHTWPLGPLFFFVLQPIGIVLQTFVTRILHTIALIDRMPWTMRRAGNLAFALVWLWWIFPLLAHDFARDGLWLLESLPISPIQGLLLGPSALWRLKGE